MKLEDLRAPAAVRGVVADALVTVVSARWIGTEAVELVYRTPDGRLGSQMLYRDDEARLEAADHGRPWSFDGDGDLFRLVSEALRIRLAHLFDPTLAVHTSLVDPLPHQITAVYEAMLPRQPLRFLLADDPGAGKTIMTGLLMKELIARGDLRRCLVVCPGSLAEQWQDELHQRFQLGFEILTNAGLAAARTGNWFLEHDLAIARLDKLARDAALQQQLRAPACHWDLVVCDEAHKMSATRTGRQVRYTRRHRLGQLLGRLTRHFLLLTATPHNGKEDDFRLFMALLDGDRFEGGFRDGAHADASDLMRRMVKEKLLNFDGTPLFPERVAHTVPYRLSAAEARLYEEVSAYVREEFDRAEALQNNQRAGAVGFAMTLLQRRLASSPEAIHQSLRRRRERLANRLHEQELRRRGGQAEAGIGLSRDVELDADEFEDLDDAPAAEQEQAADDILDQATAARSIAELKTEIGTLRRVEAIALQVRRSGTDAKWRQLTGLLGEILTDTAGPAQKLVIFTEHRETLTYLRGRIATLLGRERAVVVIHGGMGREARTSAQEAFRHDPAVRILLATDAAGEGINLQRAHLMVNYDLPWNPNRLEQRFGRIHRIGQTEVCTLWNLVAEGTREGDVYQRLLEKLEQARAALGGQVFDVLGTLQFSGRPLRDLLVDAIRYAEQPEVQARLTTVDAALDVGKLQELLEDQALAPAAMDSTGVQRVREDMERAAARRLQPHYVESFFRAAFARLGGSLRQREPRRYQITRVPGAVRGRNPRIGARYERVAFEKGLLAPAGTPPAAFLCPGHPLLSAVIDLTLERHRDLLKQGTVLVDDRDAGAAPRVLFHLEHAIQDETRTPSGDRRVVSRRLLYVELAEAGPPRHLHYAPYLDYRPLTAGEPDGAAILARPECAWVAGGLERQAEEHAVVHVVPGHLQEIRSGRLQLIARTEAAVKERLTREIAYWDHRYLQLQADERAGKPGARLNSGEARRRAEELRERMRSRLERLRLEAQLSPLPPVVSGGVLVVPRGLLAAIGGNGGEPPHLAADTQASAARARAIVMETERALGFEPTDRETERLGYDVESRVPGTGRLRFIEVKGRVRGAATITVTRNEILYSMNKPEDYRLAIVEFLDDGAHRVHYLREPFQREPDFDAASVNYSFEDLLARATAPF